MPAADAEGVGSAERVVRAHAAADKVSTAAVRLDVAAGVGTVVRAIGGSVALSLDAKADGRKGVGDDALALLSAAAAAALPVLVLLLPHTSAMLLLLLLQAKADGIKGVGDDALALLLLLLLQAKADGIKGVGDDACPSSSCRCSSSTPSLSLSQGGHRGWAGLEFRARRSPSP
jgi:hypothetical protein